jgi:GAF domain-containing protein
VCRDGRRPAARAAVVSDGMVPRGIVDLTPWPDWAAAASGAVEFLHQRVGWDLWMVTRVEGGHQIVLVAEPVGPVRPGDRIPWVESFCREMVEGRAPRVATVAAVVPEYAAITTGLGRDVAAYMGVPLMSGDGELFGTLCGVAFRAKPLSSARELPLVELVARMLSTLLTAGFTPPPTPEADGRQATTTGRPPIPPRRR